MTVSVLWLFLTVPWLGLHFVIVVFPDHAPLLFGVRGQSQIYIKSGCIDLNSDFFLYFLFDGGFSYI